MPRGVYSTRFVCGQVGSGAQADSLEWTVPAGKVAIVRSVSFVANAVGVTLLGVRPGGGNLGAFFSSAGTALNDSKAWTGHQVLNAGDKVGLHWISGNVFVIASGFLLNVIP